MSTMFKKDNNNKVGFVGTGSARDKRKAKLEADEKELEALMNGEQSSDSEEDQDEAKGQNDGQETEVQETKDTAEETEPTSAEERTYKKRYSDLRRNSTQTIQEYKDKIEKLNAQLEQQGVTIDKDNMDKWIADNPDVAAYIESVADRKAQEKFEGANERLLKLDEEQKDFQRQRAEASIRKAHPDFDSLRDDDKFHSWADDQPKWVKDALYENEDDPMSVVRVIDLYKMDNGLTAKAKKESKKAAAMDVAGRGSSPKNEIEDTKPTFSESQIKKNSDAWFEKNWDAIQEAMSEGRFIYDLSGGAR